MKEKKFKNTDWAVLIISLALFGIGLVALYSATFNTNISYEFRKQIQWALFSIPFVVIAYFVDYKLIARFSPVLYIISIIALIGVLFTAPIKGARSWFTIGDASGRRIFYSAIRNFKNNNNYVYVFYFV